MKEEQLNMQIQLTEAEAIEKVYAERENLVIISAISRRNVTETFQKIYLMLMLLNLFHIRVLIIRTLKKDLNYLKRQKTI